MNWREMRLSDSIKSLGAHSIKVAIVIFGSFEEYWISSKFENDSFDFDQNSDKILNMTKVSLKWLWKVEDLKVGKSSRITRDWKSIEIFKIKAGHMSCIDSILI